MIDDHDYNRELFEFALADDQHEVFTAENGQRALEMLANGLRPCVIFCDLEMPVLDGRGFCRAWRADPKISGIPVVIVSGALWAEETAEEILATAFLRKPFTKDGLRALLQKIKASREKL